MTKVAHAVTALALSLHFLAIAYAEGLPPFSGRFLDELQLRDTGNGRDFELLAQFRYLDPAEITWQVPKGEHVDGASIPRALWTIIGGPWSGKYRRASVIHDYFFRQQKYNSNAVHRVFFDAMLTDGVPHLKAKVMYWAVLRFNDSWKGTSALGSCSPDGRLNCLPILADDPIPITWQRVSIPFDKDELARATVVIEKSDPSLVEVERLASEAREAAEKKIRSPIR